MRIHARIARLFVDDWPASAAVVVWLGLTWLARPVVPPTGRGALLFAGTALIVFASVVVAARRAARGPAG